MGIRKAAPVHFQLCVSFLMVMRVVEQGQCRKMCIRDRPYILCRADICRPEPAVFLGIGLDIKGDLCPSERVVYPCPRWRRSGQAAVVVGNQSIALSCVIPFYRAIVPVNDEPSEEMYLNPADQKKPACFCKSSRFGRDDL